MNFPVPRTHRWIVAGLILVFAVLLFQTYEKAYRPEGYDLNAYLYASRALVTGTDPYQDGSFPYIYPLFLALVITPLLALPPFAVHFVWFMLNAAAMAGSVWIFANLLYPSEENRFPREAVLPFACLFILLFDSIQNNFLNGQVNFVVLYLCLQFLRDLRAGRESRAAIALGAATALKILPGILLFLLLFRGKFRAAMLSTLWAIGFCLLPWLLVGNRLWDYYATYVQRFLARAAWVTDQKASPIFFSVSEFLVCVVPAIGGWEFLRVASAVLVLAVIAKKAGIEPLNAFCVFLAAALLISPKSDTHHLVLLYPGAALLSVGWYRNRSSGAAAGGLLLFWTLYLLGSLWKDSPLTFASIIVLMYSLTASARPK
jgi:hypothetical protein